MDSQSGTTCNSTGFKFYDIFVCGFCSGLLIATSVLVIFFLYGEQSAEKPTVRWDASTNTFYQECPK